MPFQNQQGQRPAPVGFKRFGNAVEDLVILAQIRNKGLKAYGQGLCHTLCIQSQPEFARRGQQEGKRAAGHGSGKSQIIGRRQGVREVKKHAHPPYGHTENADITGTQKLNEGHTQFAVQFGAVHRSGDG